MLRDKRLTNLTIQKGTTIVYAILLTAVLPSMLLTHSTMQLALAQSPNQTPSAAAPPTPFTPDQFLAAQANASTNKTCTLTPSLIEVEGTPQQIEGPYFVDNMPNRSDITSDTTTGSVQEGVPLRLVINVYDVDGDGGGSEGSCLPLR